MDFNLNIKVLTKNILSVFLYSLIFATSLTGCLDTDGEIEGTATADNSSVQFSPEDIIPGLLNPGVIIGEVSQMPSPLDGSTCNASEILEWDGTQWVCVPTPSVMGGAATTVPASGVQPGTIQAGVLLPANQLTGSINPSTQIGAGAINPGVTLASSQLRSGCAVNQILVSDAAGNFSCQNQATPPAAPVASVFGRTGVVTSNVGDYSGFQVINTPAGNIASTTTQAAINELDSEKLALAGGTMTGAINMSSNLISNLATPVAGTDATTKAYVDTAVAGAAGAPGGATTQVQFNGTGAFAGDANFVWDNVNKRLGIGTATPAVDFDVNVGSINAAAICDENNANCIDLSTPQTNGTVTSIATGTGLTGGPITGSGTISVQAGGIGPTELASSAVTSVKLNSNAVNSSKIDDGTILNVDIANNTINATQKLTSACTNNQILQVSGGSGNFVCANLPAAPVTSVYGRTGVVVALAGDYAGNQIVNTAAGNIAATTTQAAINELDTEKLALAGGTMTGAINMSSNLISNLATPVAGTDGATKAYVDTAVAGAAVVPGGASTQVQFNNAGSFDGDANFVWDDVNQRLGIGTASPGHPLEVNANIAYLLKLRRTGGGTNPANLLFESSNNNDWHIGSHGNDTFRITETGVDDVMTFISGGNVGIGTAAPTERLDVAGNIKGVNLCIGNDCRSAWPGTGGGGTVTNIATGTGLTGGPITGSGTVSIANGGVDTLQLANDAVTSAKILNGTITNDDIAANTISATQKLTSACTNNQILQANGSGNFVCANLPTPPTAPVTSVYGRTGVVLALSGDYIASQIDSTAVGNVAATNVQGAINELANEKLNLAGGTMTGDISMGGTRKITSLAAPTAAGDAATKTYVDTAVAGAAGAPGGATTQVQFNNAGSFDGDANFVWDAVNSRVGIGTATPETDLQISGGTTTSIRMGNGALNSAGGISIKSAADFSQFLSIVGGQGSGSGAFISLMGNTNNNTATGGGSALIESARSSTVGDILLRTQGINRMIVNQDGNVGIGTVTPAVELDLNTGTINAASICDENNANCIDLSTGVGGGSGTVTSITAGSGLSGGTITTSGTIAIASGGISSGMLGSNAVTSAAIASNSVTVDDVDFASTDGITTPSLAAAPGAPATGQQYFNTTTNRLMVYNGTTWTELGGNETSALVAGWPDAIVCNVTSPNFGTTVFRLLIENNNSNSKTYYRSSLSFTADYDVIFDAATKTFDSYNNVATSDCNASISSLISSGNAKFFGNDIGAIAQDDDGNTKIMVEKNPDENKIRFDTAGFEAMIIDEFGNIGIGTTSPAVELDVNTGTINAAAICDENNANCIDLSSAQTSGTVTSVATGTGLTGGPITGSGTVSIANSGVDTLQLANDAVTSAKIENGTIVNADISANTINAVTKLTSACTNNQILQANGSGNFVCANLPTPPAAPVTSVYGRTGVVVALSGDYIASQIDSTAVGNVAATNVQGAINELANEKLNLAGGTMTGNISMGGTRKITSLAAPTAAGDAATKTYVDTAVAGVPSVADNMGDHNATQNISLNNRWLSSDGGNEGLRVDSDGDVGIGTGSPAGALDVYSITSGFLPPRMTEAQRDSIVGPADGSTIYNTTSHKLNIVENGNWEELGSSGAGGSEDLSVTNTYNEGVDTGATTSHTFTSVDIGSAATDRFVLAVMTAGWSVGGVSPTVNTLTIGGLTPLKVYEVGLSHRTISYWIVRVPTGTSVNVSATYAASVNYKSIHVYRVRGLQAIAPIRNVTHNVNTNSTTRTVAIDVDKGSSPLWQGMPGAQLQHFHGLGRQRIQTKVMV